MNAHPFSRVADLLTSRARGAGPTPNRMSSRDRQALARLDVLRSSAPVENVPLDETLDDGLESVHGACADVSVDDTERDQHHAG